MKTKIKILIVEDAMLDVELIKHQISKSDFIAEYALANDSDSFQKVLPEFNPDIVLCDFALPGFTGLEALKLAKQYASNLPFIIVTGAIDEETAVSCIKAGADDYLIKDRLTRLGSAIRHSIEQRKIAADKEKTNKELEASRERLRDLLLRIEEIRDEEKKRISLELHDQLGQELTATKLGLFWLKQDIILNRKKVSVCKPILEKIDELIDLSGKTIQSIRRIAHDLRPMVLDDLGLIPAIEWMIKNFGDSTDIKYSFNHDISDRNIGMNFSSAAFRIVQEGLTNAIRHAKARRCGVELISDEKELTIEIWDDGQGFNQTQINTRGQLGLFGIAERLRPFDGQLTIESAPGKGTRIIAEVPLKMIENG